MDMVCFSHLRWNFVCQRPQHLLTRFAEHFRIYYIEEPVFQATSDEYTDIIQDNVHVISIRLKGNQDANDVDERQRRIIKNIFISNKVVDYILWYYTPMALKITTDLKPIITVFDCMDELSAFMHAPPVLKQLEKELLEKADVVFTGGHSLYAAKKHQHSNIHSFPSSIDKKHFSKARRIKKDPADQVNIGYPRFGFYGVIDERFDIELIRTISEKRPDWNIILVGPIVKIDPATLPNNPNIYYLGGKSYNQLPSYLAGWDIALISFALNESTRFISPTKTLEYLAGGKPVISTPIKDVVETYGNNDLVHIVNTPEEFIAVAEKELMQKDKKKWRRKVDRFIADDSWDNTAGKMRQLLYETIAHKEMRVNKKISTTLTPPFVLKEKLPAAS